MVEVLREMQRPSSFDISSPGDDETEENSCIKYYVDQLQKSENELVLAAQMGQFLLQENEKLKEENQKLIEHQSSFKKNEERYQENLFLQRSKYDSVLKKITSLERHNGSLENELRELKREQDSVNWRLTKQNNADMVERKEDDRPDRISELETQLSQTEELNLQTELNYRNSMKECQQLEKKNMLLKMRINELSDVENRQKAEICKSKMIIERLTIENHRLKKEQLELQDKSSLKSQNSGDAMFFHFHMVVQSVKIMLEQQLDFDLEQIYCDNRFSSESLYKQVLNSNIQFYDWYKWIRELFTKAHVSLKYGQINRESEVARKAREMLQAGIITQSEYIELLRGDNTYRIGQK